MANKAYRYRIYPNKAQEELIQKTFGCVRFVYNHFLEERKSVYENNGENRSFFQQNKSLTVLKQEYPWLKEPDKNALQNALRDLDSAYKNFFRGIRNGKKIGFPKFKSKKTDKKSYSTASDGNLIRIDGNGIVLPKLRRVKARISREIPKEHRIISATISQEPSGKYFVSVNTEYDRNPVESSLDRRKALGLDYSSPHFYVDSNGTEAGMPHFYREAEKRLAREQRKLSKMVNGSNNWKKQKILVAVAHEKIRNCRKDWHHKESTRLANQYDIIVVEGINYKDMSQGLHLSKATNDNGFGQFREMLSYKLAERGKKLVTIDKWFPSSKLCRFCGSINSELKIGQQEWDCACGAHLLRDHNAAVNIRDEGLRLFA